MRHPMMDDRAYPRKAEQHLLGALGRWISIVCSADIAGQQPVNPAEFGRELGDDAGGLRVDIACVQMNVGEPQLAPDLFAKTDQCLIQIIADEVIDSRFQLVVRPPMTGKQRRMQTLHDALDRRRRRQVARSHGLRSSFAHRATGCPQFEDEAVETQCFGNRRTVGVC